VKRESYSSVLHFRLGMWIRFSDLIRGIKVNWLFAGTLWRGKVYSNG